MKNKFQAKNIQQIFGIPKYRYEYIATKIGIQAGIEEVEGQGRAHLYSYKNLLQFGFAHHAINLGFSPKNVRLMLNFLDEFTEGKLLLPGLDRDVDKRIFDPGTDTDFIFYNIKSFGISVIGIGKRKAKKMIMQGFYKPVSGVEEKERIGANFVTEANMETAYKNNLDAALFEADGYIAINIGAIKRKINRAEL